MLKRKAYDALLDWKKQYNGQSAALLEGARRVGKSTIAEEFARKEYRSYILIDFANITKEEKTIFDDIADLDNFFLRLQVIKRVSLYERQSVIIFDEIQLAPHVRQAIKYLVKDGRYDYIETGSLISIRKNVKDILIPSEEYKINVYPMDYQEFMWACDNDTYSTYSVLSSLLAGNKPIGEATNRKLMKNFRLYMAVGGMPQAVVALLDKRNFSEIDAIKQGILSLYMDDFRKIDQSGRLGMIFNAIPSQLALGKRRFVLSNATSKRTTSKDEELLFELIDSKTVIPCYDTHEPNPFLAQTKDLKKFKLYLADIGLFTTMLFANGNHAYEDIYIKLLGNSLNANLGYLYENAVAQIINSSGRELYFHTWREDGKVHQYEIDFLLAKASKIIPIEVKSSATKNFRSIIEFSKKYSSFVSKRIIFSQKDIGYKEMIELLPIYLAPAFLDTLNQADAK